MTARKALTARELREIAGKLGKSASKATRTWKRAVEKARLATEREAAAKKARQPMSAADRRSARKLHKVARDALMNWSLEKIRADIRIALDNPEVTP